MSELKPCPLCAGEVIATDTILGLAFCCQKCHAIIRFAFCRNRNEAVVLYNTRIADKKDAEIARLKGLIEDAQAEKEGGE